MAVYDRFTAEERARQHAITRSWQAALADLADPDKRARLEAALVAMPKLDLQDLSPSQQRRHDAITRSWMAAQRTNADPWRLAELRAALDRLDDRPTVTDPATLRCVAEQD